MTQLTKLPDPSEIDFAKLDREMDRVKGLFFTKPNAGFLGSLLCNHNYVWDLKRPTAWCDGKTIGFNPFFFQKLPLETRITVLAHELWHTGYDHFSRIGTRDPMLWNYAGDYVINWNLHSDGFTFQGTKPLLDKRFANMTTEEVYKILEDEAIKMPVMMSCPQPGEGQGDEGSQDDQPMQADPNGPPLPDLCGDLMPAEIDEQEIKTKVVQAIQSAKMSRQAGSIPGEIEVIIDQFLNPVLPWEQLLMRYFTEMSNDDYSWKRPSRRYDDEYLPALMGENGLAHLMYFFDVSGSVTDSQIQRFNSEVKYIHSELKPELLTIMTFDTKIQDVYEFAKDDTFDSIKVTGRGGTSLRPVYEQIKKHQPTAAIVFSDLYCAPMEENPGSPILWVVVDHPDAAVPFGQAIHIPDE